MMSMLQSIVSAFNLKIAGKTFLQVFLRFFVLGQSDLRVFKVALNSFQHLYFDGSL